MEQTTRIEPLRILMADDGSKHSQAAIQFIQRLPAPSGSHIKVITVFPPRQISDHEALSARMETTAARLSEAGYQVETELILGYPAEKILEVADQISPSLIVLGARGLRATLGILLGGVAQQVVEYANWPVLVVRAPDRELRQILLVTDGSECSHKALHYIQHFPLPSSTKLEIMHVLPPTPLPSQAIAQTWPLGPEMVSPIIPELSEQQLIWQQEEEEAGRELLARTQADFKALGLQTETIMRRGDAASEIIDYCQKQDVDLIIAGSRGLSSVRGWLLGSVSRKLIHYAGCSVLIVKGIEACS